MPVILQHPLPDGRVTDKFGWRTWPNGARDYHTGQDWAAPGGTPVYAAHAGRVTRLWWDQHQNGAPAGGNMIRVTGDGYDTRYAHLSSYAVGLGVEVQSGQLIGYVGRTGAATGDHLHFELVINGSWVDPVPYIHETTGGSEMAFESIRHPDGTITFADEYGIEGIDAYRTADIGVSEYLGTFGKVFGPWQQLSAREWDIARAIASRRQQAIEDRLVEKIVKRLKQ